MWFLQAHCHQRFTIETIIIIIIINLPSAINVLTLGVTVLIKQPFTELTLLFL